MGMGWGWGYAKRFLGMGTYRHGVGRGWGHFSSHGDDENWDSWNGDIYLSLCSSPIITKFVVNVVTSI